METPETHARHIAQTWRRLVNPEVHAHAEALLQETPDFAVRLPGDSLVTNPISFGYRALHQSFKMYHVQSLIGARAILIAGCSSHVPLEADLTFQELLTTAKLCPLFTEIVSNSLDLRFTDKSNGAWVREATVLFAGESITRLVLRAIVLVEPEPPVQSLSEAMALLWETYDFSRYTPVAAVSTAWSEVNK